MNNHTEDKTVFDVEKLNEQLAAIADIHNNAIQSCIDVVRNDTFVQVSGIADRLIEKLQSLKK